MKQIKYFRILDKNNHYIPRGVLEIEYDEKNMSLNLGWSICVAADSFSKKKAKDLADLRLQSNRYSIDLSNPIVDIDYKGLIEHRLSVLYKKKRLFSAGREISNRRYNTWTITTNESPKTSNVGMTINNPTNVFWNDSNTNVSKTNFLKTKIFDRPNLFHEFITFSVLKFVERFQKES